MVSEIHQNLSVGEVLDCLKFATKCFFIEKSSHAAELSLLTEIFLFLPTNWTYDPVKVCFPYYDAFYRAHKHKQMSFIVEYCRSIW